MKARFFSLFLISCIAVSVAKPEDFPRGRVIQQVACADAPNQGYALYLPTRYDPSKKWPAIFAFDPMGQGARPAELLQPAAEKYGYIVVASNNSRNGPMPVSMEAMQAMWIDSRRRLAIDDERIYSTGFSGGARIAMQFGLMLRGRVQGVIPAGAGLPAGAPVQSPPSFAVYAIVGIRDFNFGEMKQLDDRWDGWGLPHHLEVTAEKHRWPAQESFTRAIEWMELQAVKSRMLAPDPELLNALWAARLRHALELEKAGKIAQAYRAGEFILADFRGLREVTEAEELMGKLRASADIAKLLKKEERREAYREQLDAQFTSQLATVQANIAAPAFDRAMLQRSIAALEIDSLRREIENGKDEDRSIVADRQIQRILVGSLEDAEQYWQRKEPGRALASLQLTSLVRPESAEVQFLMARALAANHNERDALKALAKAAELGFSSRERIENEPAFDPLRQDPQYARILARIQARAQTAHP